MRIIFCGGKPVGVGCLRILLSMDVKIVSVFVNEDDYAETRWYDGETVKEIADKNNIPVHNNIDRKLAAWLSPDIIISVYYDRILKKDVIDIPRLGCINLHLALAWEYRGCFPSTWAIMNGERFTGVTLHYIDEGIDSGDVIDCKSVMIFDDDTGKSLYMRLTNFGINLFEYNINSILNGKNNRDKQVVTTKTKYYPRQFPPRIVDGSFNFYDHIRALIFPPFPMPKIKIGNKLYELKEVTDEN